MLMFLIRESFDVLLWTTLPGPYQGQITSGKRVSIQNGKCQKNVIQN